MRTPRFDRHLVITVDGKDLHVHPDTVLVNIPYLRGLLRIAGGGDVEQIDLDISTFPDFPPFIGTTGNTGYRITKRDIITLLGWAYTRNVDTLLERHSMDMWLGVANYLCSDALASDLYASRRKLRLKEFTTRMINEVAGYVPRALSLAKTTYRFVVTVVMMMVSIAIWIFNHFPKLLLVLLIYRIPVLVHHSDEIGYAISQVYTAIRKENPRIIDDNVEMDYLRPSIDKLLDFLRLFPIFTQGVAVVVHIITDVSIAMQGAIVKYVIHPVFCAQGIAAKTSFSFDLYTSDQCNHFMQTLLNIINYYSKTIPAYIDKILNK